VAWEGCSMAGSSISAADHSSNTFIRMGSPHPEQLAAGAQPMAKEQEETQRREGGDRLQRALDSYHGPRVGCSWHHHRLFGRECASQPAAQAVDPTVPDRQIDRTQRTVDGPVISMGSVLLPADRSSKPTRTRVWPGPCTVRCVCVEQGESH
jgi:hypothetical protein